MRHKTRKNILIIIGSLQKGGGAENVAYYQSHLRKNFNITYLTFYNDSNVYTPKEFTICFHEKHSTNPFLFIWRIFSRAYKMKKICTKRNILVSIAHMPESSVPLLISSMLFNNKTKSIICIHNSMKHVCSKFCLILLSLIYINASKIVGVSKGLLDDLFFKKWLTKKYTTIYNAIDLKHIPPVENKATPTKKKAIHLISIGRLVEQKNYFLLIEALSKLKINFHATIVGDGPLKEEISNFISSKNLDKTICMYGYSDNVFALLKEADIFVMTSNFEGFGIVLLEAMACGVPIITTDCEHGPREIVAFSGTKKEGPFEIGSCGILVPTNNPSCLYEAITFLSNNKNVRMKLKTAGLNRINDFNLKVILKKWTDEINDLL